MFCWKCWEKLSNDSKFCWKCGASIGSTKKNKKQEIKKWSFQKDYWYFGYLIDNYISNLKQYAVFKGRISRIQYWSFVLVYLSIAFILSYFFPKIAWIYIFATFLPLIWASIRRAHDSNKSGWFMLVPFYNLLIEWRQWDKNKNQYWESINDDLNDIDFSISAKAAVIWMILWVITLFSNSNTNEYVTWPWFLDILSLLVELVILLWFLRIAAIMKLRYIVFAVLLHFYFFTKITFYTWDYTDHYNMIITVFYIISFLLFGTSLFTLITDKLKTIPILLGIMYIIMFFSIIIWIFIMAYGEELNIRFSEKVFDVINIIIYFFTAMLFFQLDETYDEKKII